MTSPTLAAGVAPRPLQHRAFLFGGMDDFLSRAVPFVREGLDDEDRSVVVVVAEPRLSALRDLFPDCADDMFIDASAFYAHPVRTLRSYLELVKREHPLRVHALAEPVWRPEWTARETLEWARYESLINEVFKDTGASALCPYDTFALPPQILEHARRTHPRLVQGDAERPNARFAAPEDFSAEVDRARVFPAPHESEYLPVTGHDLHELRRWVGERSERHGLSRQDAQNLVTAVNEVAANALVHGTPPFGVRLWTEGPDLVCEVGDNGYWNTFSPLVGFVPPSSALENGFGLWTVRLLVDLVEVRAGWDGTFVRMRLHR
ncbi:sensor histidine kinase [Actinomadura rupiterrae]|uniref:sensor histidine kinase n=1 Tax=Actinomadura rupiterrae TaxID=559627 RepID=UPI0020A4599D|nr:sensor histidine kinase [Actinomadura rupiterrae]MCP2334919.1 anti-sigma regulatory factor (Ser/Thr protein kinase) [Actinomadura rupiterrae]